MSLRHNDQHQPVGAVDIPCSSGPSPTRLDVIVMPSLVLQLDDEDFKTINAEITKRQKRSRWPDGGVILPEGESDIAGALVAEAIRDLNEYRSMFKA